MTLGSKIYVLQLNLKLAFVKYSTQVIMELYLGVCQSVPTYTYIILFIIIMNVPPM